MGPKLVLCESVRRKGKVVAARTARLVAIDLPPGAAFVAAADGAWARGDALLPVDPAAPAQARLRLTHALGADKAIEPGVALVIATSGSTGEPKGVMLTHEALDASTRLTTEWIGIVPGDKWLSCLPWHHIGGLQVLLRARRTRIPVTIHEQFDVERVAAAKDCTLVALVPTQLVRLLDAGVDMARFRAVLLGGAAAHPTLLERAANAGARIAATYGMSETAGGCVYDGLPLPEVNVRIQPDSRIAIRGPMLMAGYRNRPDLTNVALKDGWLLTNDIGDIGADHRLHVLGRADDIVITGGENISTTRVAAILMDHPHIRDAEVVGVPDSEWGHRVVAVVVARDVAPTLEQLRAWVAHRASIAAAPRGMVVVSELPRLASGKLDRGAVADIARSAR